MTQSKLDPVRWRLSRPSIDALTRLVGAPLGMRARTDEVWGGADEGVAAFSALELFNFAPQLGRRARLSTDWHTSEGLFDWHELNVTEADHEPATEDPHAAWSTASALAGIEAVTLDLPNCFELRDGTRVLEDLSLDAALNFVFADGEAVHLTTDIDSIVGAVVVSSGRFDPAAIEWEGMTHAVRPLLH